MKKVPIDRKPGTAKFFRRFLLSVSNTSRSLLVTVFGLSLNYLLLHFKSHTLLNAYVYCLTVVGLLQVLCGWGGKEFIMREISANKRPIREFLGHVAVSRFLLFIAAIPFLLFIPLGLQYPLVITVFLLCRTLVGVLEPLITLRKKFHSFLFIDVILNTLVILVILFDGNTDNVPHFLIELLLFEFLKVAVLALMFRSEIIIRFDLTASWSIIKISTPFFLVGLAGFLCSRADLYVLGFVIEAKELSRYYILLNMVILCNTLFYSFSSTFAVNIFRYTRDSFIKFEEKTLKMGGAFSLVGTCIIYYLCDFVFRIPIDSIFAVLIFLNLFIHTSIFISVYYFTRISRQDIIFKVILISGIFSILIALVLVKYFGTYGAFTANTACGLFTALIFKYSTFRTDKNIKVIH